MPVYRTAPGGAVNLAAATSKRDSKEDPMIPGQEAGRRPLADEAEARMRRRNALRYLEGEPPEVIAAAERAYDAREAAYRIAQEGR